MFSSVFDKVVSATAPDTLATFPSRADLPASASTLCCLSFADRFISHYPTARGTNSGEDADGGLRLERVGPSIGIAISTDDLESTMESAAELGGRLAAALAGTVRSKRREPATASVSDLLTKVRGIFGNRLACVGREIRVSRNVQAERDETLLLRQVHALKSAAVDACNGEKWCVVVSSGEESLVVCSVPLPAVEEGGAFGCDFLVFDPSPRPAMKLRGSYIVKFTTVRGLQLHLLSALGEIWRGGGVPLDGGAKKEFVGLSVVMKAKGREEQLVGRRQLQDSVTSLRKAEKATAIKTKREEVEALRRALEKSSRQPKQILTAPISGGMFGLAESAREVPQEDEVSDLSDGPPSVRRTTRSYRRQEPPRTTTDGSRSLAEELNTCVGDVQQTTPKVNAGPKDRVMATTPRLLKPPAPDVGFSNKKSRGGHRKLPDSRVSSGDRSQLCPPAADVSPPLSVRTPERKGGGWRRCSEEDDEMTGKRGAGEFADSASKRRQNTPPARGREHSVRVEPAEQIPGHTDPDEDAISDDPLLRALLRPIEGEELADYSKRAYSVYRAHGIIQDETELNENPVSEPTVNDLSMSANRLCCLPATSPPASPANTLHGASSSNTIADDVDQLGGKRKECGRVGVGVRDAVMPFSPPPSSPQLGGTDVRDGQSLNRNGNNSAEPSATTSGHELRVTDFYEAEDVAPHKPDKPATSPSEKFRSRLQVPRAGRALALASANARGKRGSGREEMSPGFRRDVSGKELLPPPPPSSKTSTVPSRRREAWTKEGGEVGHELPVRTGGHEPELGYSVGLVGTTLEVSDEDEDEIVALSSTLSRKAVEHDEGRRGKRRSARHEGRKSAQDMEEQERIADGIEIGGGGHSEHRSDDEHAIEAKMSKEWPMDESTANTTCVPITSHAPVISPRLKDTTPWRANGCHRGCDNTESHVTRLETVPAGSSSFTTVVVAPPPLNTRVQGLHRSRNSDTGGEVSTERGGSGEPRNAPENDEFVWFGQPDTPSGLECQPEEDCGNTRDGRDEGGTPVPPAAPEVARTMAELQPGRPDSYAHQQHRSKAQLLLQMEVRRQRAIIEQAFRAREEERRARRARIGAEVFKRIQDLRRPPSPPAVPTVRLTFGPKQPPPPAHDDQEREPQAAMHVVHEAAAASPGHTENAVKAWGFRPARSENTPEAAQPERLVPDATPSEGVPNPPVETLAPVPPSEFGHRVAAAADNPWRRVVSRQKQPQLELEGGPAAKREPTPPPIRFNVEASAFLDGAERADGGISHEQENARRQERYEALRARKMAEAEERRRGQKQRQDAAREGQRMKTAAATAAADDDQPYGQHTKNDPRRQNSPHHGLTIADGRSVRQNGHTPRTSAARPHSSTLTKNDDSFTRQGVSSLGDSNGSGGGGGGRPRLPAPGAGSVASPAVRGFSRRSNRKLVRNAINFLCLAGGHLEKKKARVLEALDSHPASNFVVLLAHTKLLSFKGLYACSGQEDGTADRVFGLGPPQVDATMVAGFYKYNSAAREFREVHSKSLGKTTDAVSMEPTRLRRPNFGNQ